MTDQAQQGETGRRQTGQTLILEAMTDIELQPLALSGQEITIGREKGLTLFIDSTRLSRKHARIYFDNGVLYIQDLNSTNGTYVNGERVEKARLKEGDTVQFSQDPVFRFLIRCRSNIPRGYSVDTERTGVLTLVDSQHDTVSEFEIANGEAVFIGRSKRVKISIQDPELAGVHCRIQDVEGRWNLDPMDPSKQVRVNGEAIKGRVEIKPGDVICVGTSTMKFSVRQAEILHPAPSADRVYSMEKDFSQEEEGWASDALRLPRNPTARQIEEAFTQIAGECREQIEKSGSPKIREWYSKRLAFLENARTILLRELQGGQTLLLDGMGSGDGLPGASCETMAMDSRHDGQFKPFAGSESGAAPDSSAASSSAQGGKTSRGRAGILMVAVPYIFLVAAVSFLLWEIFWAPAQRKREAELLVEGRISQAQQAATGQEDWAASLESMANSELLQYPDLRTRLLDKAFELRHEARRRTLSTEVDKTIGRAAVMAKERGGPQAAALLRELLPQLRDFPDLSRRVQEMIKTLE